jgi:hypothetical protein
MRKRLGVPSTVLLALLPVPFIPSYAQNAPTGSDDSEHAKHSLAVNLLRAINTAEVGYRNSRGVCAPWDTLVASEEFANWMTKAVSSGQIASVSLSKGVGHPARMESAPRLDCGRQRLRRSTGRHDE